MPQRNYKLVTVTRSPLKSKKFTAVWSDGTKTHFGATGYEDYTQHANPYRRSAYRQRHRSDNIYDPKSPGALSWWLLWGQSTDLKTNIREFREYFKV